MSSKVFIWVIFNCLQDAVDRRLKNPQAGFRKKIAHSQTTATLFLIIEQSIKWNTSLYMTFTDEKAFNNLDRTTLWQLTDLYPHQAHKPHIKNSYDGTLCKVMHAEAELTRLEWCYTCSERSGDEKSSLPTPRCASSTWSRWCCMDPKHGEQ